MIIRASANASPATTEGSANTKAFSKPTFAQSTLKERLLRLVSEYPAPILVHGGTGGVALAFETRPHVAEDRNQ